MITIRVNKTGVFETITKAIVNVDSNIKKVWNKTKFNGFSISFINKFANTLILESSYCDEKVNNYEYIRNQYQYPYITH